MSQLPKPIPLTCCCCGAGTLGRQWYNRDTGYGLCDGCVDFCARGASVEAMRECYGEKGVHYALAPVTP